jgi:glycerol-3-phosphate dehydrogenase
MTADFDLFIIGGGINGTGIARDAQGAGCVSLWRK